MPKFRKKPVVIEAWRWRNFDDCKEHVKRYCSVPEIQYAADDLKRCEKCGAGLWVHGVIKTLEDVPGGAHLVCPGDFVIKGIQGEFYACKPDIFEATYEPVTA